MMSQFFQKEGHCSRHYVYDENTNVCSLGIMEVTLSCSQDQTRFIRRRATHLSSKLKAVSASPIHSGLYKPITIYCLRRNPCKDAKCARRCVKDIFIDRLPHGGVLVAHHAFFSDGAKCRHRFSHVSPIGGYRSLLALLSWHDEFYVSRRIK